MPLSMTGGLDHEVQSMLQCVKVSSKNQISIPSSARRQLGIEPGDRLVVVIQHGVLMLIPEPVDPVTEIQGLGREIWEGVDAQEYVNSLRDE